MKINFNNVSFKYNPKKENYALFDLNLSFFKNEIIFIMGESGSGKSTLIQQINGLLIPSQGEVSLNFKNDEYVLSKNSKEKRLKQIRKHCGLAFQFSENQLFETSVLKDVMFGPYNFSNDEKQSLEDAKIALTQVGIDKSYYERSPFELSGGEKRKIAIAGILAFNPDVLILDEPTASLDLSSKNELMKMLVNLKKEGKMIFIVSHDIDLCYEYADKVVVLKEGKLANYDSPFNIFFDEKLVEQKSLALPFVVMVQKKLGLSKETIKNIDGLVSLIRGEHHE